MNYDTIANSNRSNWEFEYTASVLAKAAMEKKEYRQSRVVWWEEKQKVVMAEVKTTEGRTLTGTLAAVDEEGITMAFDPKKKSKKSDNSENTDIKLAYDAILEAKIEISFD